MFGFEVNLVDVMGMFFTAPVLIPYGQSLGASTSEIASFNTVARPRVWFGVLVGAFENGLAPPRRLKPRHILDKHGGKDILF